MSHLTSETQLEGAQEQIVDVSSVLSNVQASLAAAQAENDRKVEFLRGRVKAMDKEKVALPEKENLLLQAQRWVLLSIATTHLALYWLYVRAFSCTTHLW